MAGTNLENALSAAERSLVDAVCSAEGVSVVETIENIAINVAKSALEAASPGFLRGLEDGAMEKLRDAVIRETALALARLKAKIAVANVT